MRSDSATSTLHCNKLGLPFADCAPLDWLEHGDDGQIGGDATGSRPLKLAVVGHTNVGKTSLLRT